MDEKYIKWVEHENELTNDWIRRGHKVREIEGYVVEARPYHYSDKILFRIYGNLEWYSAEPGMTLKQLEQRMVQDVPFIKSVQFVIYIDSPIIT
jgi:hypothetical protein